MARAGHRPIVILGGGTGLVGDPSGKAKNRESSLSREQVATNLASIRPQFARFFGDEPLMVDNADWLTQLNYLEFLRDVGQHFSVNEMLAAETYANRLENNEHLSFVEFNYRLVQAYDFLHLFREHGCQLQVGGSDQWGNCVAGTELIRKTLGRAQANTWVLTAPLLLTPDGRKMGKSEKGSVWLDASRTSPYEYFQYWINSPDELVGRLLKTFTFLDLDTIAELVAAPIHHSKAKLAYEATALCHGADAAGRALATSMLLFGLDEYVAYADIVPAGSPVAEPDIPRATLERAELDAGLTVQQLFCKSGLCKSGRAAKDLATQGGANVNGDKRTDPRQSIGPSDLRPDGTLLLRAGKKKYCLVSFA